jgi:hypothetical protein
MSFFWVSFSKATRIKFYYANNACDVLAWIGLSCYSEVIKQNPLVFSSSKKILSQSIGSITSVIDSYTKNGEDKNHYHIADLIMFLWYMRLVAIDQKDKIQIQRIDEEITNLDIYNNKNWKYINDAFLLRHRQLKEGIFHDPMMMTPEKDNSISLLSQFLKDENFFNKHSPNEIKYQKKQEKK